MAWNPFSAAKAAVNAAVEAVAAVVEKAAPIVQEAVKQVTQFATRAMDVVRNTTGIASVEQERRDNATNTRAELTGGYKVGEGPGNGQPKPDLTALATDANRTAEQRAEALRSIKQIASEQVRTTREFNDARGYSNDKAEALQRNLDALNKLPPGQQPTKEQVEALSRATIALVQDSNTQTTMTQVKASNTAAAATAKAADTYVEGVNQVRSGAQTVADLDIPVASQIADVTGTSLDVGVLAGRGVFGNNRGAGSDYQSNSALGQIDGKIGRGETVTGADALAATAQIGSTALNFVPDGGVAAKIAHRGEVRADNEGNLSMGVKVTPGIKVGGQVNLETGTVTAKSEIGKGPVKVVLGADNTGKAQVGLKTANTSVGVKMDTTGEAKLAASTKIGSVKGEVSVNTSGTVNVAAGKGKASTSVTVGESGTKITGKFGESRSDVNLGTDGNTTITAATGKASTSVAFTDSGTEVTANIGKASGSVKLGTDENTSLATATGNTTATVALSDNSVRINASAAKIKEDNALGPEENRIMRALLESGMLAIASIGLKDVKLKESSREGTQLASMSQGQKVTDTPAPAKGKDTGTSIA